MPMRALHIFRAGKHVTSTGVELAFSEQDLIKSAEAYNRHFGPRAKVVLGHPSEELPSETAGPVHALIHSGGALYALADIAKPFIDLVREGRFKYCSASFHVPFSEDSPARDRSAWYLRHVGLLGALPPAIKGLEPLSFAEVSRRSCLTGVHCDACAPEFSEREQSAIEQSGYRGAYAATGAIPGLSADDRRWFAQFVSVSSQA